MKTFLIIAAVLTTITCGTCGACFMIARSGERQAATAAAPTNTAATSTYVPKHPEWWTWSPRQVFQEYEENEIGAEQELGRRIRIVGLVEKVERDLLHQPMLTLQAGKMQFVVCRLRESSLQRASLLRHGGLVAIEGKGVGKLMRGAEFVDCDVTWVFDQEDPAFMIGALGLARSAEICLGPRMLESIRKTKPELEKAFSDGIATSTAELAKLGLKPVDCSHPLLPVIVDCDGETDRPECAVDFIKAATAKLGRAKR